MPISAHACRIVEPSGTSTGWSSIVRLTHRARHANTPNLPIADSMADEAVWPRPQIEESRIAAPISAISASSSSTVPRVWPGQQPRQRLLLAHRPDATGHALPAALVAEERGDHHQQATEVHAVVDREHDAGAERDA